MFCYVQKQTEKILFSKYLLSWQRAVSGKCLYIRSNNFPWNHMTMKIYTIKKALLVYCMCSSELSKNLIILCRFREIGENNFFCTNLRKSIYVLSHLIGLSVPHEESKLKYSYGGHFMSNKEQVLQQEKA